MAVATLDDKEKTLTNVRAKPNQALVWISLLPGSRRDMEALPKPYARVPALLDTGCNAALCLNRPWFEFLVGKHTPLFPIGEATVKSAGAKFDCIRYGHWKLWLHRNDPGSIKPLDDNSAAPLYIESVDVHDRPGSSYPCLGMPVIMKNNLHVHLNGALREASVLQESGVFSLQRGEVAWKP